MTEGSDVNTNPPAGFDDASQDDPYGIREVLRGMPDPGPMPDAVTDRITAALRAEAAGRTTAPAPDDVNLGEDGYLDEDTHIRRLLAAQPDPGPMPDLVERRIQAALAGELRAVPIDDQTRIQALLQQTPDPGPMPADVTARITEALRTAAADRGAPAENVRPFVTGSSNDASTSTNTPRTAGRSRTLRLVGGLVAAAVAGVVAVSTLPKLLDNQQNAPVAGAPATSDASDLPPGIIDKVHLSKTGTAYTSTGFAQQAGNFAKTGSQQTISPAEAAQLGSVGTKEGALRCAGSIGSGLKDNPNKIDVDIATYDAKPALVVVVTKGDTRTAWVLGRDCDKNTTPIAGPTTVS